ncbi:rolling circle replication-associated protein [Rubinisphaera brasiliensis]|uniref:Replication protein n=1 Tax=Rubinisphaera brasiliensis (strain ATCC 49424 / DSM 5305 / JCM 21570 / IAM 15109 / NBRC 103401 / IFAM 1448) TaxID=756272 RepID=F0SSU0_RUBBR|nr:hypothetical protein [Rubinisphaera brasiliensis]ADY61418.1 hypothetical protein Plabr_3834 [Rubinisphaera brasiliensis DSM 5305]
MEDDCKQRLQPAAELPRSGGELSEARPQAVDSYLEIKGNVVDGGVCGFANSYYALASTCRSWFCEKCCLGLGLQRRALLYDVLKTFGACQMWTLTIDPLLFASPLESFLYVRKRRSISELVRALKKGGHLLSRRYFYVVEWQKNTEMPHWHLLVDARHIPFDDVCEIWNRNRPKYLPPPCGDRPAFGSVRYSAPKFSNAMHAANYATKYLIKHPEHGYPPWVRDFNGRIQRFGTSRGFWPKSDMPAKESQRYEPTDADRMIASHRPECECRICRGEVKNKPKRRKTKTVGERVGKCGEDAVVMNEYSGVWLDGSSVKGRRCLGKAIDTYAGLKERLNPDREMSSRKLRLEPEEVTEVLGDAKRRHDGAEWPVDSNFENDRSRKTTNEYE